MEYVQRRTAAMEQKHSKRKNDDVISNTPNVMMDGKDFKILDFGNKGKKEVVQRKVRKTEEGGRELCRDENPHNVLATIDSERGSTSVCFTEAGKDLITNGEITRNLEQNGVLSSAKMLELLAKHNKENYGSFGYNFNFQTQKQNWTNHLNAYNRILEKLSCFSDTVTISENYQVIKNAVYGMATNTELMGLCREHGGEDLYKAIMYLYDHRNIMSWLEHSNVCVEEIKVRYKEMQQEKQFLENELNKDADHIGADYARTGTMMGDSCDKFARVYSSYFNSNSPESAEGSYDGDRIANVVFPYSYHKWNWLTKVSSDLDGAVTAETCVGQGGKERVVFNIRPTSDETAGDSISKEQDIESIKDMGDKVHTYPERSGIFSSILSYFGI